MRRTLHEMREGLPVTDQDSKLVKEVEVKEWQQNEFSSSDDDDSDFDIPVEMEMINDKETKPIHNHDDEDDHGDSNDDNVKEMDEKKEVTMINPSSTDASSLQVKVNEKPIIFGSSLKKSTSQNTTDVKGPSIIFGSSLKKRSAETHIGPIKKSRISSDTESSDDEDNNDNDNKDSNGKKSMDSNNQKEGKKIDKKVINESSIIMKKSTSALSTPQATEEALFSMKNITPAPLPDAPAYLPSPLPRIRNIAEWRSTLPVLQSEQEIIESILINDITVLSAPTGSGKSTQLPQMLYEHGFGSSLHPKFSGKIGMTQPRRVAAVAVAKRIKEEMNLSESKSVVGYQVRYDSNISSSTKVVIMTDGILLRHLSSGDLLLKDYSVIIVDEAHERTVATDVIIGWLRRIAALRNRGNLTGISPFRAIIMSATLNIKDFVGNSSQQKKSSLPNNENTVGCVGVEGRQYKVTIHYNKKTPPATPAGYLSETYRKVSKIHTTLPRGGILVFVTGAQEVKGLVRKLKERFGTTALKKRDPIIMMNDDKNQKKVKEEKENEEDQEFGDDDDDQEVLLENHHDGIYEDWDSDDDRNSDDANDEEEELHYLPGEEGENEDDIVNNNNMNGVSSNHLKDDIGPLHVIPLYSMLSVSSQMKIFEEPPEGHRLCVIATNVAETSLTIPGIRYVVDCGKVKEVGFAI